MSKQFYFKQFSLALVYSLVQFHPYIGLYQVLLLQDTVKLGAMAIKGYFAFPEALVLPSNWLVSYPGHSLGSLTPLRRYSRCILPPKLTGPVCMCAWVLGRVVRYGQIKRIMNASNYMTVFSVYKESLYSLNRYVKIINILFKHLSLSNAPFICSKRLSFLFFSFAFLIFPLWNDRRLQSSKPPFFLLVFFFCIFRESGKAEAGCSFKHGSDYGVSLVESWMSFEGGFCAGGTNELKE